MLTKIVKVHHEQNLYEIIITSVLDGELKNFNLLFVEHNFAICTDDKMLAELSNELKDKFRKQQEIELGTVIMMPKSTPKPTKLDKDVKEIVKNFDKILKVNKENISQKNKFVVSNCTSPSEIWIQEAHNLEINIKNIQNRLIEIYTGLSNSELTSVDWSVDELCVWKHAKYQKFKRGKIVEKYGNNLFKVRFFKVLY
jgi:hypothetical protein